MSLTESHKADGPYGPSVGDNDDLYRALVQSSWWVAEENRVSSAAFSFPVFSVNVASLVGSPEASLSRFEPGSGLASVSCASVKAAGGDPRLEKDPENPDNHAHANVYMPIRNADRKRAARKLADACQVLRTPTLAS